MSEALTFTKVPMNRAQVKILLMLLQGVNVPQKEELKKVLERAERRMDPYIPHGKGV